MVKHTPFIMFDCVLRMEFRADTHEDFESGDMACKEAGRRNSVIVYYGNDIPAIRQASCYGFLFPSVYLKVV